jgi:DNA-binding SARP family transcriptional activator
MDELPARVADAPPTVRSGASPRIYICGRLAIEAGPSFLVERHFPARQGRRLWVYLVLNRARPVGRERLAAAVWGDELPESWESTLNALVSRLRTALKALPDVAIRGEPGRYGLELPAAVFVDLERARAARHAADAALRLGDPLTALAEARVAMEIAARGFLDGEESPWINGERAALHVLRLSALECTVEAEFRRGNLEIAEREAEHLTAIDPLWEPGYRLRMRAAIARGNPAHGARILEQCRSALRPAGLEPSNETLVLARRLVDRERASGSPLAQ